MAAPISIADLQALSPSEKLTLIEQLWESLVKDPESLPISETQRAELDRRLEALERDPSATVSWEELRARVRRP